MKVNKLVTFCIFVMLYSLGFSQIKLPYLIGNDAILQHDSQLKIWGWSSPKEKIAFNFNGNSQNTIADESGNWEFDLPPQKAGGPYSMTFSGKNEVTISNIFFGDVWLCAGQSNMVHQLDIHDVLYENEIATANYPEIRHFKIPTATSVSGPKNQLAGGTWQKAIGEEVRPFSAVSYFFAKKIYEKYHIPIGLINASVGGTRIEAWTPEEGFEEHPEIVEIIKENRDPGFLNSQKIYDSKKQVSTTQPLDKGLVGAKKWYHPTFIPKNWRRINIPGYWEDQGIKNLDGTVWYRREINIPSSMVGKEAKVFLGRIVDADEFYINGQKIGNKTYQYPQRRYKVSTNILQEGKNVFVIRVTNKKGKGGFVPDKPYCIFTKTDTIDLKGYWEYKVGQVFKPIEDNPSSKEEKQLKVRRINHQSEPSSLYNAMVAPFVNYSFKGILWYQGESNTGQPEKYEGYMHALVNGWREVFNRPEIPVIYAQLPNFLEVSYLPSESGWAQFRESQLKALSIPNTAMTVNIDLGEWNDIHPDNKKDVGERMALAGMKLAYNENIVFSGPLYKEHKIIDDKISISFSNIGSGLVSIDGEALSEFAIAGEDKNFVWAQAKIEGNKVIVWNDEIKKPKYVRYAWADNPDNPNLFNAEGLPASPFQLKN